jgi:Fic family protein
MFILFVFKYCSLTKLKDASNAKYYKHLQFTHFSFQDTHNINIYINENDNANARFFFCFQICF